MFDFLIGAGEFAGTAGAGALLAGRGLLAHHVGMQRARAFLRELIGLRGFRTLVEDDIHHLRNHVPGALDNDGVADADIAALAQNLAFAADPLDVVLVMQRRVLHHDAADRDRFELGDRRKGAGAADLDLDVFEDGQGALGRELVRDRPARRARDEAEPLLPVEAVDFVNHAVDVVIEMRTLLLDLAMKTDEFVDRTAELGQGIGGKAATLEPFDHAGLRCSRHVAHFAPGVSEEAERPRGCDRRIFLPQ